MASNEVREIEWETPPAVVRKTRRSKYDPIVDALKDNPGQWAKVMVDVNSATARVLITNGCTITTRQNGLGEGKVDVWAVFVEDGEEVPSIDTGSVAPKPEAASKRKTPAKKTPAKKVVATTDDADDDAGDAPAKKTPPKKTAATRPTAKKKAATSK